MRCAALFRGLFADVGGCRGFSRVVSGSVVVAEDVIEGEGAGVEGMSFRALMLQ